ncbi:hypothetical protein HX021_10595 [Sphingobacterium sp. N143]|uniref:hypothetical protein n=1 Tax=Sphingobacterium sp. N143 TaxID=2746727 RepID=UPI0025749932|nr:hypothetical protein [Sphingobacterium sp. N143]MDM1294735.1 hypothetical protein [Sphingobacterium sp. N143]
MNLKHLFLTIAIITTLFFCKKSDSEPIIKNEEDLEIVNSTTFEKIEMKVSEEIKTEQFFVVGYGYDAKENLLFVNKGLRGKILDTKKMDQSREIYRQSMSSGGGEVLEDISKDLLIRSLGLRLGFIPEKFGTTETEIIANIPESGLNIQLLHFYAENFFYRTYDFIAKNASFQQEEFINFVKTNSPIAIVKKYGTHLILSCSKGASVKLIKYLNKKIVLEDKVLKDWKVSAFVLGGDLRTFEFHPTKNTIDVSAWLKTLTEENADFIGFGTEAQSRFMN